MLLEEPGARDRMIRALEAPNRRTAWILSAAVAAALSAVVIAFVMRPRPKPPQVAMVTPPAAPVAMSTPESAPPPAGAPRSVKAKAVKKSEAPANQPVLDQPAKDATETASGETSSPGSKPRRSAISRSQQFTPQAANAREARDRSLSKTARRASSRSESCRLRLSLLRRNQGPSDHRARRRWLFICDLRRRHGPVQPQTNRRRHHHGHSGVSRSQFNVDHFLSGTRLLLKRLQPTGPRRAAALKGKAAWPSESRSSKAIYSRDAHRPESSGDR